MPPKGVILRRPTTRSFQDANQQLAPVVPNLPSQSIASSTDSPLSSDSQTFQEHAPSEAPPPVGHLDEIDTDDSAPTLPNPTNIAKKGRRGRSIGKSLEKEIANNGNKLLEIEFIEGYKKPIKYASHLANGIGIVVRHSDLDFRTSWKKVPEDIKLTVYAGLDQWFDIKRWGTDRLVQSYIDDMFYESYKHFKGRLSQSYKEMVAKGINPKTNIPFDWIESEKWETLCDYFATSKFQERSTINARNRSCMPYPHTSGSKSFTTRLMNMEKQSCVDNFGVTHMRNGEYVNHKAAEKHKEMISRRSQNIEDAENSPLEREIMKDVLGVRSGYERGMGSGVVSSKGNKRSRCESTQLKEVQEKLTRAENELLDAVTLIRSQQETIQSYNEEITSLKEDRKSSNEEIASLKDSHNELKQMLMKICAEKLI